MSTLWKPAVYQGEGAKGTYFEGWYFKMVDATTAHKLAVIPGIYRHKDPSKTHAFIQTLDGTTGQSAYHQFPAEAFKASTDELDVRLAGNRFRADCVQLDLPELQGTLDFGTLHPWPVRPLSPGVMGPFAFVPGMQCYHGVIGFDHPVSGTLDWNGQPISFDDGRGYIEKDWGRAFPRAYVWMQTNHFPQPGVSLIGSIATIPFAGSWFRGLIFAVWLDGTLYRFTTYLNSTVERLSVSADHVEITLTGGPRTARGENHRRYRLALIADRAEGGTLAAPEPVGMIERVVESMTATVHVTLSADAEIIYEGTGLHAGLEVSGTIQEILSE